MQKEQNFEMANDTEKKKEVPPPFEQLQEGTVTQGHHIPGSYS